MHSDFQVATLQLILIYNKTSTIHILTCRVQYNYIAPIFLTLECFLGKEPMSIYTTKLPYSLYQSPKTAEPVQENYEWSKGEEAVI